MRIDAASEPGSPDVPNEDWWGATSRVIVVLDGVSVPAEIEQGCRHGTPWFVRHLGTRILQDAEIGEPLADALWYGIRRVADVHREKCDLASLGSPSAAVAILRVNGGVAEYLVLADTTIAVETADDIKVISDDRVSASVAGVSRTASGAGALIAERRAEHRNRPGGYWVAASDPDAAGHALTGEIEDVRRGAVMTDGAAAIRDMILTPWSAVLGYPAARLISRVRAAEQADPDRVRVPRWKVSDDATAVMWRTEEG